jgi:hypothetical protein
MNAPFPPEIWSGIFRQLPNYALPQLLRVCRAWREIANATPQLWTHVRITKPYQFAEPAGLSQWLKRSGECALDVAIMVPAEVTDLHPTLALLRGSVSRFRHLSIRVPNPDIIETVVTSIALSEPTSGNPAPILEELHFAVEEVPVPGLHTRVPYFEYAFNPAPRLRRLTLPAERLPAPSSRLLSTISYLGIVGAPECQPPDVETMLDIITAVPRLRSFRYAGVDVLSFQPTFSLDYPRIVEVPYLQEIDVTVPGCGLDIIQLLHAPNLRSVRLDGWREHDFAQEWEDGDDTPVSASLKRLPQRAPCIRSIDICFLEFLQPETFEWLLNQTDFAQLEELLIEGSTITDAALTHSGKHRPHLRRLELRDCENITGIGLMAYIKDRQSIGLENLELLVDGCLGVTEDHLIQLSQLVNIQSSVGVQ